MCEEWRSLLNKRVSIKQSTSSTTLSLLRRLHGCSSGVVNVLWSQRVKQRVLSDRLFQRERVMKAAVSANHLSIYRYIYAATYINILMTYTAVSRWEFEIFNWDINGIFVWKLQSEIKSVANIIADTKSTHLFLLYAYLIIYSIFNMFFQVSIVYSLFRGHQRSTGL